MRAVAIYALVSSDRQKEEHTIASQTAALMAFAREQDCDVPVEWVFEDEGYSGASSGSSRSRTGTRPRGGRPHRGRSRPCAGSTEPKLGVGAVRYAFTEEDSHGRFRVKWSASSAHQKTPVVVSVSKV